MRIDETACKAKGTVVPSLLDIMTGEKVPFRKRFKTLSYMSAEAMAAAFGGDSSYIPSRIGFIYGDNASMPSESVITRSQSWKSLIQELSASDDSAKVDIQVVGFSYPPSLGASSPEPRPDSSSSSSNSAGSSDSGDDSSGDYCNILPTGSNAITFHAVSNSQDGGYARGSYVFTSGKYVYQAVLLGYHLGKLYVISRSHSRREVLTSRSQTTSR